MHKLYNLTYAIVEDKERDYFWDSFLFTEEEQVPVVDYTYNSFDSFYDDVVSNKLPVLIDHGKTMFTRKPYIYIGGDHYARTITKSNFTNPTSIRVECHECSPKFYGYDFFKKKLSLDDFVIFMQEHYGSVMDDNTLKIMLGK